jgi:hypothetical protein
MQTTYVAKNPIFEGWRTMILDVHCAADQDLETRKNTYIVHNLAIHSGTSSSTQPEPSAYLKWFR